MAHLFIRWEDCHPTGLAIIDEQHRGLVAVINSFFFHKNDPFIERILVPTALMAINLAKIHFLTEQQLMEQADYPLLEEHTRNHETMFRELINVERKARMTHDPEILLDCLKSWWSNHANDQDRLYIEHLKGFFGDKV
jgi:hemerythrin-like metal-binding protein